MKKNALTARIIIAILLAAVIGVSVALITVESMAKKVNLVKADVSRVPSPAEERMIEKDAQLKEMVMHYGVIGKGKPLILIHGNGSDHTKLSVLAKYLANDYTVYAIDSRCHGGSTDKEIITYDLMASDVNDFINTLALDKPYIVGHSDGGIIALKLGYQYPENIGAIVACGANTTPKGLKGIFDLGTKINYFFTKSKLQKLMLDEPNITAEELSKITAPSLILAGEFDMIKLSDTKFIAENIPNANVTIVKWADHSSYLRKGKEAYALSKAFFDGLEK